jgi:excinuclease ABC subunit A
LGRWTAITGVSGSGKSSFAFDTLFSEAQRRFLETLGTYERQFLAGIPQGDFESIDPVPPAIALKQTNRTADPRSVIGTTADIIYPLRTLFAAIMDQSCQDCGNGVIRHSAADAMKQIIENHQHAGLSVLIELDLPPTPKTTGTKTKDRNPRARLTTIFDALRIEGYTRARIGNRIVSLDDLASSNFEFDAQHGKLSLELVLDVLGSSEPPEELRARIDAVWEQVSLSDRFGSVNVFSYEPKPDAKCIESRFHIKPWCGICNKETKLVDAGDLDWQSTLGCCKECGGLGNIAVLDPEKIIPDPKLSLKQGAIKPWKSETYDWAQRSLFKLCKDEGIPTNVPYDSLTKDHKRIVWQGNGNKEPVSIQSFFAWLESEKYKHSSRILLAKYRRYRTCPACGGARIGPAGRHARAAGSSYDDIFNGEIRQALAWCQRASESVLNKRLTALLEVQRELFDKLSCLEALGLGSSSLSRRSKSLSGGEYQRVLLSRVLGNGLSDALYVLDEPSIGLGATEIPALITAIRRLRDQGNTVVMVDHEPSLVRAADEWIEFGPGGGSNGGNILGHGVFEAQGTKHKATGKIAEPASLSADASSLIFPQRKNLANPLTRVLPKDDAFNLLGFSHLNCDGLNVEIPLGRLTVICGPSGAGKTTLLRAGLEEALQCYFENGRTSSLISDVDEQRGCWRELEIPQRAQKGTLVTVDQKAMHRSITSVPATLLGLMDELRKRFAATLEARELGLGPSDFSFNGSGACGTCEGRGITRDDLFFLGEVERTCEDCSGCRYRPEVLAVPYKGSNIAQVLEMSIADCFNQGLLGNPHSPAASGPAYALQMCINLGVGHLPLGIPSSQISGGEAQRLRIAAALTKKSGPLICLIDEPSRGLSESDIIPLLAAFQNLCHNGHTIGVVEHHTAFQRAADQLLEMGPGAGVEGGQIHARSIFIR